MSLYVALFDCEVKVELSTFNLSKKELYTKNNFEKQRKNVLKNNDKDDAKFPKKSQKI